VKKKSLFILILLTPFLFWLTHVFAYFIHEYSHSFSAWIFGFKHNPFDLTYGDSSWGNILSLYQVSENVEFDSFSAQHPWIAALTAFAGFGVGNVTLLIISLCALQTKNNHSYVYYYFFFWLIVMNLGNFIDYVPARTLATHGDMQEIVSFLNISPWWLMTVLGYPICYSFWYFYSETLPYIYVRLQANTFFQAMLLMLSTLTMFGIFGAAGMRDYGPESHLIALLSWYITPIIIIACWPTRDWVREKIFFMKS
jgi:hypothetical protein